MIFFFFLFPIIMTSFCAGMIFNKMFQIAEQHGTFIYSMKDCDGIWRTRIRLNSGVNIKVTGKMGE